MIKRIETTEWLYIIDTETEWDGIGEPVGAKSVWQCPINHETERPAYEALYARMKADEDQALQNIEDARLKAEAEKLAMIENL